MMKRKKEEQQFLHDLSLSDLPDEIVIDILERLDSLARIRFSAVCKGWKLLIKRLLRHLGEADELPWLITFDYPSIVLCEPCFASHQKKSCTAIEHDLEPELIDAISPATEDRRVFAVDAKFGWVVFELRRYGKPTNLVLYSPFTKKHIYVRPELPSHLFRVWISHPPTSPDCVLFAFSDSYCKVGHHLCFYTCRIGDKNWKKYNIMESVDWAYLESVMFMGGSFYCLFDLGTLAAFDIATEAWAMLTELHPLIDNPPMTNDEEVWPEFPFYRHDSHLVKSHGDIWLVLVYEMLDLSGVGCGVWKYEWGRFGWTKMRSLGGQVVFLDMSLSQTGAVAAAGQLEGLADRIYYDSDDDYYYSLWDQNVHGDPHLEETIFNLTRKFWIVPPSPQL